MTIKANIYRGEVRRIYPTPEYPDPAKAAEKDPAGVLGHWLSGNHPWLPIEQSDYGMTDFDKETGKTVLRPINPISAGVHWSYSPQTIPERFTESAFLKPQAGAPMPRKDINYINAEELLHHWHNRGGEDAAREAHWKGIERGEIDYQQRFEEPEHIRKARSLVERRQYSDPSYRDLSHGTSSAKPYTMGVVWHGSYTPDMADPDNPPTNYEDEVNLRPGVHVPVHAVRFHIPQSGVTAFEGKIWHPTPSIVMQGAGDSWNSSAYSHAHRQGRIPWNTVQFKDVPIQLPVEANVSRQRI